MKRILSSLLLVAGALAGATRAQEIDVRLSIKFILTEAGTWPPGTYGDPAAILPVIDQTNAYLDRMGRGYRYVVTEFVPVLHVPTASWNFHDLGDDEFMTLENTAEQFPVEYAWRTNATNVYVVNSAYEGGGLAPIASNPPDAGLEIVVITGGAVPPWLWPHELGHHFNLNHTFGAGGLFGDDGLADTLPDPESACASDFSCTAGGTAECCCATKLQLLNAKGYAQVDDDNLLYNTMSYFGATDCVGLITPPHDFTTIRLTNDQLDRWTDATRLYPQLQGEVSGFTYFVDEAFGGTSSGLSTNPYKTVATGISAASSGNGKIVLVRGGLYPENLTITTPITLRAAEGAATIGQ